MKNLVLFVLLVISFSITAHATKYKITCNNEDCFRFGWKMVSVIPSYELEAICKKNDCTQFGWTSIDNQDSRFDVTCNSYGCFNEGWISIEKVKGKIKYDFAKCKKNGCLVDGWDVKTSYGESGTVSCMNNDCSRFGGIAYWRKKTSKTSCLHDDCYRYGWLLDIKK